MRAEVGRDAAPVRPTGSSPRASPSPPDEPTPARGSRSIWWFALGYFVAYVPYALLTKALSDGSMPGVGGPIDGRSLVPVTTAVSAIGMVAFLAATGLHRRARRVSVAGVSLPFPRAVTWASGACTALIVLTTTLAYTFEGTSIVMMMLLMRGGVLVLAPIVDAIARRRVRWFSWAALVLSLGSVVVAVAPTGGTLAVGAAAALDATIYLAAYFGRLRLMSGSAKRDRDANLAFFVEEQLVATPLALVALGLVASLQRGADADAVAQGALDVVSGPALPFALVIGLCSQATGIFGALVLLDARENSFSVPVNRASSILAGVVATGLLALFLGGAAPPALELAGAAMVLVAIVLLSFGSSSSGR